MPKYYKVGDPGFFDAITPPQLRFAGEATREVMPGWDLGSVVMGDEPTDPEAPVVSMLKIAPGDTLPRHAHDCYRVEVVIQGSITLPDGDLLRPGDIMTSSPCEYYGPHVAGDSGCLSVEIFSSARGMLPISDANDAYADDVATRVHEATSRLQGQPSTSTT
ncbi:hypothetical protein SKC41_28055 [Mycobacterium sp. 050128]|uniref:hypothetical protein n=1 Tax=Mycobacterium sp. 050128 TaxID=3096112 RepID=UPI002ED85C33